MNPVFIRRELTRFLEEDLGHVDVNDRRGRPVHGAIKAQEAGILCGARLIPELFVLLTPNDPNGVTRLLENSHRDGDYFKEGEALLRFQMNSETLRHGIRTALNLLQHLSGITTRTAQLVEELKGTGCRLLDTRKTTPGLRAFEKYAVRTGGGVNHRFGRFDGTMIKKEDLALDHGITAAINNALEVTAHLTNIEVEVESLQQLEEVLKDGRVRHVLLDNMTPMMVRDAVRLADGKLVLEASGVTPETFKAYAATGVPFISSSALIRTAKPIAMHLWAGQ